MSKASETLQTTPPPGTCRSCAQVGFLSCPLADDDREYASLKAMKMEIEDDQDAQYYSAPGFKTGPVTIKLENMSQTFNLNIPSAYFSGTPSTAGLDPHIKDHSIVGRQAHLLKPIRPGFAIRSEFSAPLSDAFNHAEDRSGVFAYLDSNPNLIDSVEAYIEELSAGETAANPVAISDEPVESPSARDALNNGPRHATKNASKAGSGSSGPTKPKETPKTKPCSGTSGVKKQKRRKSSAPRCQTPEDENNEWQCRFNDCDEIFTNMDLYDKHAAVVHMGQQLHQCGICKQTYLTEALRDQHEDTHSGLAMCPVPGCGQTSVCRAKVLQHFKTRHPKEFADSKIKSTWDGEERTLWRKIDLSTWCQEAETEITPGQKGPDLLMTGI